MNPVGFIHRQCVQRGLIKLRLIVRRYQYRAELFELVVGDDKRRRALRHQLHGRNILALADGPDGVSFGFQYRAGIKMSTEPRQLNPSFSRIARAGEVLACTWPIASRASSGSSDT